MDALPPDAVLASELCPTCADGVTAVDLNTGELRPLRSQPAFTGFGLRLARVDGDVIWVAQVGPGGGLTAVSADRGRTWRTIPLAEGMVLTDPVVLASIPGGGAYLSGAGRTTCRTCAGSTGRTATWRRITPPDGPNSAYSAVVDARGLLVGDGNGKAWRLGSDDQFTALPGTPGHLSGSQGAARSAVDAGHRRTLVRRRADLAVGAAGLTNRGARGLGGRPGAPRPARPP